MSKLWPKYKNWSKLGTEQQLYRYNPKLYRYNLAKNDQKRKCTGTNSNCTGTSLRKVPRRCNFSPFSCTFPSQTKSILHIHFKIISNSSYILNYTQSSFNTYLSSKYFMIFSQNNSNMGHNPYKYQIHKFIRVCSNPTLLPCN